MMKFEDYLMQRKDDQDHHDHVHENNKQKRVDLEEEVEKLLAELDGEQTLNKVFQCALHRPVVIPHPSLSSLLLPPQVQTVLSEMAMVEEEIICLERKVEEMKMRLYHEKKHNRELQLHQKQKRRMRRGNHILSRSSTPSLINNNNNNNNNNNSNKDLQVRTRSQNYEECRLEKKMNSYRRASVGSEMDLLHMSSTTGSPEIHEKSRRHTRRIPKYSNFDKETFTTHEKPNVLSEELIKCLIGIYLDINEASSEGSSAIVAPKLGLPCMNTKGFIVKSPSFVITRNNASNLDPYGILPDLDGSIRDIGPYKNLIQITRISLDISRFTESFPAVEKLRLIPDFPNTIPINRHQSDSTQLNLMINFVLCFCVCRVLMHKLSNVDLTFLTYKQKLAFWINIYNACIMHAFLEHGLPSSQEKLLALMNKAALNVGGIVLNALAIEHFILRHPSESSTEPTYQKEMLLRHAYGLGYPEPNLTFALCRGSWSSPALRVYTPEEVVNELERAKVEYLEASVGVTSKRKIVVPKLLQWHMRDFADDMESLLEWIYSQLPRSGSLKRLMMECLNGDIKAPITKMVETQPYESEFRYLLPL
ncbi:hypothetical protein LWI28_023250 [Acer negundo]|uniref:DUF547 domain-containing protein n=1 Tax=Acer negundo TaxID=4023 RepID=A0AAD5IAH2_ACENE|nr:hypothetical protein LWI28_023250 [Acer negundo]